MTFHTCFSPAPTPVKPQPAPAILSPESVHTTLSITHHIRKRPSTGPRTTHGPHHRKPRLQTPVVSCYPAPRRLRLAFPATMRPALDPAGQRVHQVRPTCLSTPRRPRRHRPFAPTLHLHQCKLSRNLHLQYSAKSQSTPRCQSLITARSDHPPILRRSGPQKSSLRQSLPRLVILSCFFSQNLQCILIAQLPI
jgi:hypothetical protein